MNINSFLPAEHGSLSRLPGGPAFGQRILVVAEDAEVRRLNTESLAASGYRVDAAENGLVAWRLLVRQSYDLVFTDQHLPKLSGVELLRKIHEASMTLQIIMATRVLPTWEFVLNPWLQPATMMLKPYTFENLLRMIRLLLNPAAGNGGALAPVSAQ